MGYEKAIDKAWVRARGRGRLTVKFLDDEYVVDTAGRSLFSASRGIEARDHYKVLILHYVAGEPDAGNIENDSWISFKELEGGKEYYSAFRKRAVMPILERYGNDLASFSKRKALLRCEGFKEKTGDSGLVIRVFPKIKMGIALWAGDDEFGPDCSIVFNSSIRRILSTEDIAVMAGIVAGRICTPSAA